MHQDFEFCQSPKTFSLIPLLFCHLVIYLCRFIFFFSLSFLRFLPISYLYPLLFIFVSFSRSFSSSLSLSSLSPHCLFLCPCMFVNLSPSLSGPLSTFLPTNLSVCPSVFPSVCLSLPSPAHTTTTTSVSIIILSVLIVFLTPSLSSLFSFILTVDFLHMPSSFTSVSFSLPSVSFSVTSSLLLSIYFSVSFPPSLSLPLLLLSLFSSFPLCLIHDDVIKWKHFSA